MLRLILSAVAAFFISNIGNTAYYAITADWNRLSFTREEPLIGLFVAHHVLYAALVAGLYPRFRRSGSALESLAFGLVTGTLVFVPNALVVRGAWEVPVNLAFLSNTAFALFIGVLVGVAVALIQGGGAADRASA
ncbi:MAG: hypothetical protein H6739_06505 [Alphaproteobacteria bacterium]|nr:hypothetical protein [Alphaproteobacteria bacterium]